MAEKKIHKNAKGKPSDLARRSKPSDRKPAKPVARPKPSATKKPPAKSGGALGKKQKPKPAPPTRPATIGAKKPAAKSKAPELKKPAAAPAKSVKGAKAPPPKSMPARPLPPVKGAKGAKPELGAKPKPQTPVKKKLLVGQKPRSEKPSQPIITTVPLNVQKAFSPVSDSVVKASPPSAEAKQDFKVNDYIVYPAHGVGRIVSIEKQLIAGVTNELFLIDFEQEKMKLRVPTGKAKAVGMRALSEPSLVKKAVETLKGRARIKRTMWSRRAQEYDAKINSGDIIAVAEVVRDLFRATDQPEQSYSERQLFEAALDRLAREVAAVNKTDVGQAIAVLEAALAQKKAA